MVAVSCSTLIGREVGMSLDWEFFFGFTVSQVIFWLGFLMGTTYGN